MISNDEYSKLLDQQFETKNTIAANKIISGTILKISDQHITVDIGYKSEGQIPKEEFLNTGSSDDLKTGQVIEVFVEKLEDREGNVRLSHEKAIKMKSWEKLQKLYDNNQLPSNDCCDSSPVCPWLNAPDVFKFSCLITFQLSVVTSKRKPKVLKANI